MLVVYSYFSRLCHETDFSAVFCGTSAKTAFSDEWCNHTSFEKVFRTRVVQNFISQKVKVEVIHRGIVRSTFIIAHASVALVSYFYLPMFLT